MSKHGMDPGVSTQRNRHSGDGKIRSDALPETLLIDADDTLWENNIYFLRVTAEYAEAVEEAGIARDEAIRVLGDVERRTIAARGYGSHSFAESIAEAYRELAGVTNKDVEDRLRERAMSIFYRDSMELRLGVAEALRKLASRFRLILVTKGHKEEQERKLARSELAHHFEWVEVVAEKDVSTYTRIVADRGLDPTRTWMVGNSPKSDINPAVAAGLGAVLIPHPDTWELEMEELSIPPEACFMQVDSLLDLAELLALSYSSPSQEESLRTERP